MKMLSRRMLISMLLALASWASINQSAFSSEEGPGCTRTQGYWKTHPQAWPVSQLKLGGIWYTKAELLAILKTPTQGNGAVSLARQLIAAKLNVVATGITDPGLLKAIADATALLKQGCQTVKIPDCVLHPSLTSELTDLLDDYNSGIIGPGSCE